jgi:hypothetical protein
MIPNDDFRFNHYNLAESSIEWAFEYNFADANRTHIDDTMKKYVQMLKEYCKGKCSDNY